MSPQRTVGRNNLASGRDSGVANAAESESLSSRLGFGLLLLFLAGSPWFFSSFWVANYDYFPQVQFLAGTAVAALFLATAGLRRSKFQLLDWLLLGFVAWCALSLVTTVYLHDSLLELSRILGVVIWFFVARSLLLAPGGRGRLPAIAAAVIIGMGSETAYSIYNYVVTRDPRQFGSYITPNLFANAIAMALPFALILPIVLRRRLPGAALLVAALPILLLTAGLIVTSSKGGLLSALMGLGVTAIAISRARPGAVGGALRRYWPFLVGGLVVFGLLALRTIVPRLMTSLGGTDYSAMFRLYTWKGTWAMALAKPMLGHGAGSFAVAFPQYAITGYTRHAHEVWLQLAAECGLPAMLLFAAATLTALASGWRQLKTESWPYVAAAIGAVVAFVIHGLSDSGWNASSIALLLMVCFAILGGTGQDEGRGESGPRLSYSWIGGSLAALAGVMLAIRAFTAEDSIAESGRLISVSAPTMAMNEARKAVDADPASSRTNNQLGDALVSNAQLSQAMETYRHAADLAPTRSANWLDMARTADRMGDQKTADANFEHALELDPNSTKMLAERAEWRLAHNDPKGYDDLKRIVWLWDQPYGLYAATPEFVNMDFTHAAFKLLPQMVKSGQTVQAKHLMDKASVDLYQAQLHDASNRFIAQSMGAENQLDIPTDLESIAAQIDEWRAKLGMPARDKS